MNKLERQKSWIKRNWKWLIPTVITCAFVIGLLTASNLGVKLSEIAKVHTETKVLDSALAVASKHGRIVELLGELQPLGKLSIIEGSHRYSKNYNRLEVTVNVRGTKSGDSIRSKMDVVVDKIDNEWVYQIITVRIKKPVDLKQTITILKTFD